MPDMKRNFTVDYSLGKIIAEYVGDWYCKHNSCGVHCICWWDDKLGLCSDSCNWQPPKGYIMINEHCCYNSHAGYFIPQVHMISWIFEPLSDIQTARKSIKKETAKTQKKKLRASR